MNSKFKIVILGMGGVGGYFGGMLARHFNNSDEIDVYFIARGENETVLRSNGLKLVLPEGEFVINPKGVTNNPAELGNVDLVICSVKGYDLDSAIELVKPCVDKNTGIVPLLNGVSAAERIQGLLPGAEVWNGCVYIISHRESPGFVKVNGDIRELYFGTSNSSNKKLEYVQNIFISAGINASLEKDILKTIWAKFIFISPMATLTTYLDKSIGEILANGEYRDMFVTLVREVKEIALAKRINIPEDIVEITTEKAEAVPFETTSSMHKDFRKGGKTEFDSLTSYVVRSGKESGVSTPLYDKLYLEIINNNKYITK